MEGSAAERRSRLASRDRDRSLPAHAPSTASTTASTPAPPPLPSSFHEDADFQTRTPSDPSPIRSFSSTHPVRSLGEQRRVSLTSLLPSAIIFFCFTALPSAFLGYLLSRPVTAASEQDKLLWKGAVVVDEGGQPANINGNVTAQVMQSTLYGLTFASLISSLISFTVPPLMGTVAYRIANDWLTASAYPESSERAPTPLQYGIMIRLFSSSNIFALLESGMYLSKKRARTASYIIPGFVVLAFVLFVSHGISIVDLWLHSTSGTLVYDAVSPISDLSQLSFGTNIDTISCPFSGFSQGVNSNAPGITCQVYQLESNNALMEASLGVADNRSSDRQVVMLGDMAVVIVPAAASSGLSSLTMDTLGMSASCAPPPCSPVDVPILAPNSCQIQTNTSVAPTSFLFHPSSGPVPANWTQATTNPFGIFVALSYSMLEVMLAPVGISVSFDSSSNVWLPAPATSPTSWAIETNDVLSYNSFCNITTYNVTLNYQAGGYSIVDKVPSDFNTMSAVSAGFTEYLAQLYLLPGITTALHSQITNRDFDSQFAAQLASYGLALSGGLMTSQPVSEAIQASQRVASRYPLAPLVTFLALLYLYSLTALGILLWTALFCKAGSVVLHLPDGTTKTVGLLELAQLRLTSPIAMVADTFQSPINGRRRDAELKGSDDVDSRMLQSIATNPLHLFGDDTQRLTIGIRPDGFRMERIGWHGSDEDGESTSLINGA